MSKQGGTVGGDFNELRDIIDKVEDKDRVGVCLDTCHAMAAGRFKVTTVIIFFDVKKLFYLNKVMTCRARRGTRR